MTAAPAADLEPNRGFTAFFVAAVALNVTPILWFAYLPTRDGPAHALNAQLVRTLLAGTAGQAAGVVGWNPAPVPNWLGHAIMAAAGWVVSALQAERLLQVLIVVSLPVALRYAIRASTSTTTGLEFFALPLAWGGQLHWGFYNFALSLSCFLVSVGYWVRHREHLDARRLAAWSLLLVTTYFAGAQALLHAGLVVGIIALVERQPGLWRRLAGSAAAAVPALGLFVAFTLLRPHVVEPETTYPAVTWAAANLFRLDVLRGVDGDRWITTAMALAFGVLAVRWCVRSFAQRSGLERALTIAFALEVVLVFAAPTTVGGGTLLTPREAVFALLTLTVCFSVEPGWLPRPALVAAVTAILTVALHVSHAAFYGQYDRSMREFVNGAPAAITGGLLLAEPLDCPHPAMDAESGTVCLSGHAGAYAALARDAVLVNDYELQTAHFPLRVTLPIADGIPVRANGSRLVDTVMLWRGTADARRARAVAVLRGSIGCEIHYGRLIPVSVFTVAACR